MPLIIDTDQDFDIEDLQYDIEDSRETDRWTDAPAEIKELFPRDRVEHHRRRARGHGQPHQPRTGGGGHRPHPDRGPHGHRHRRGGPPVQDGRVLPPRGDDVGEVHARGARGAEAAHHRGEDRGDRHRGRRHRAGRPARHRQEDRGDDARSGRLHRGRPRGHGAAGRTSSRPSASTGRRSSASPRYLPPP